MPNVVTSNIRHVPSDMILPSCGICSDTNGAITAAHTAAIQENKSAADRMKR